MPKLMLRLTWCIVVADNKLLAGAGSHTAPDLACPLPHQLSEMASRGGPVSSSAVERGLGGPPNHTLIAA